MKLYCATTNAGKLREFRLIVAHYAGDVIQLEPLPGLRDIPAPEETGSTFAENARLKAEYYSRFADHPLFSDDSGLTVEALGGAPGIYSARFAGEHASDAENNGELLRRLEGVVDRQAKFVCAIALAAQGQTLATFEDSVEGAVLHAPQGGNGFGYDPLFYYEPFGSTFGQATADQKLLVSHRGKALRQMVEYLQSRYSNGI